jgi:UDP-N-acetylglucosamine 2-epimerase (non-hydrolysing)
MLIYLVAGARPNFMKIAPIVRALQAQDVLTLQDHPYRPALRPRHE